MIKRFILFLCVAHIVLLSLAQMQPEVGLKTGQIIHPTLLKLKNPFLGKSYLLLDETQKIKLDEVDYYQTTSEYFIVRSVGFSSSTPLKRIEAGEIAVYEYMRIVSSAAPMGPNGMMGMSSTQRRIDHYYTKDGGSLQFLSLKNLKKDLDGYPPSLLKLKKARSQKLIKWGLWITGGAMVIAGLNQMVNEANEGGPPYEKGPSVNAPFVIGMGMMVVPFFIHASQGENLMDAVRLYNAHYRD